MHLIMERSSVFLYAQTHTQTRTHNICNAELQANWDIKQVGFNWQGGKGRNDRICCSLCILE